MRRFLTKTACTFCLLLICWPAAAWSTRPEIKVGIYNNPPTILVETDGSAAGIFPDILTKIADTEGWHIEYVTGSWAECLQRLESGEIDLLPAVAYSTKRAEKFLFNSETVISNYAQVYVAEHTDIQSPLDLINHKVAVLKGDIHYQALKELLSKFQVKTAFLELDNYDQVMDAVKKEAADAGVVNRLWGHVHEAEFSLLRSPVIFNPIEMRYAANQKGGDILETIDRHLVQFKENQDSVYFKVIDKWLGLAHNDSWISRWNFWILGSAAFLVLVLIGITTLLRGRVATRTQELELQKTRLKGEIAEHSRTEHALREMESRFQKLFQTMPQGVVYQDRSGQITLANPAALRLLGLSMDQLLGRTSLDPRWGTINEDGSDLPGGEHPSMRALRSGREIHDVTMGVFNPQDNDRRWIKVHAVPEFLPGEQEPYQVYTSFEDITFRKKAEMERERLEAQLRHSQKMEAVGTLAGGIAHDFNNILQVIHGYVQMLLLEKSETHPDFADLNEIRKAGDRAAQLLRQLLLFSRKVETKKKPVNLNSEVEQAVKMLERTIPRMIQIDYRLGDGLWLVEVDPVQMEQILLNLGSNANDAMPDGGKLAIRTENIVLDGEYVLQHPEVIQGNYVLLTVADTGQGINKDALEHIFEPFYTTKALGKGTGLGLASVYGIVKNHGGHIRCQSEPGVGTSFEIYFPAIDGRPEIHEEPENDNPPAGGIETILLVDDEEPIRDYASKALTRFGYTVKTAASGEEALQIYRDLPSEIDLIVMDIGMPGMGGRQCLSEIIRLDPSAKVVIASGYSMNDHVKQALETGARAFVAKPYMIAELLKNVRTVLDEV